MSEICQDNSPPVSYPLSEPWQYSGPSASHRISEPWQDRKHSISSAFHYMMKSKIFVDVIFKKDKSGFLYAHKLILSIWSPYFEDLVKQSDKDAILTIYFSQDFDVMETVLEYIYSSPSKEPGFTKMPIEKIIQILEITERFQLKQIHQRCISSLQRRKINVENVVEFFDFGLKNGQETIVKKCKEVFSKRGISMKKMRQDISISTLLALLSSERLAIHSESTLLNIAISWLLHPKNILFKSEVLSFIDLSAIEWNEYQTISQNFPEFFSKTELTSILFAATNQDVTCFPSWYKQEMSSAVEKRCDTCIFVNKRLKIPKNVRTKPKEKLVLSPTLQDFEFHFRDLNFARLLHIEFTFGPRDIKPKGLKVQFCRGSTEQWEDGKLDTPLRSNKYELIFPEPLMIENTESFSLKFHFQKGSAGDKILLVKTNKVENQQLKKSSKRDFVEIKVKSTKLAYYCETEKSFKYLVSSFYFNLCENHVSYLIRKRIKLNPENADVEMDT